jgi:hypothetical protein
VNNIELILQNEIVSFFRIQRNEIKEFNKLEGSNAVYSFTVKEQKYVIKKLIDKSIMDW